MVSLMGRGAGAALLLAGAFAFPTSGRAQDAPSIEALRSALAEQQRTLDEQAAQIERQRIAIAELTRKLDVLSPSLGPVVAEVVEPAVAPSPVRETRELGSGPRLRMMGHVQVDALYFPGARAGEAEDLLLARLINTDPGAVQRDRTRLSARDTRLGVEAIWPAEAGSLKAYLEFDFFGEAPVGAQAQLNGYEPRLRQAYLQFGPGRGQWSLTLGQTWSAFADPEVYGSFYNASPFGAVFVRQPQIRYTRWLNEEASVFVSIENPETETSNDGARPFDRLPDLALGARLDRGWGHVQLSGVLRSLHEPDASDSEPGWGIAVSGLVRPGALSADALRFQVSGGRGVGRYLSDLGPGFDGWIDADGRIRTRPVWAITANYEHAWSPRWRSAIGLSTVRIDDEGGAGDPLRATRSVIANTVFSPVDALDIAAEVAWSEAETADGRSASSPLYRLSSRLAF